MICIRSYSNDPFFNLAAEEYLMKNSEETFYFQYINHDSVVVGKHQNALAEVDLSYLHDNEILLARRISGGGAVYHDRGNLNYSFLSNEKQGDFIQFRKYTAPIIEVLAELTIEAKLGERNEILVGDKKISGTASHVYKNRVLHHGTLLFDAQLERLARCLYVSQDRFDDKAVRSIRSEVINIRSLLEEPISMEEFSDYIFTAILNSNTGNTQEELDEKSVEEIEKLRTERFSTWDWNYGYSPKYQVKNTVDYFGSPVQFTTLVVKGMIARLEIEGDPGMDAHRLDHLLIGRKHDKPHIHKILKEDGIDFNILIRILQGIF